MIRSASGLRWGWLATALVAAACEGEAARGGAGFAAQAEPAGPGELRGELEVRIVDHFDGSSARDYRLLVPGEARPRRLAFAADPGLEPGAEVAIWAAPQSSWGNDPAEHAAGVERIQVARWQRLGPAAPDGDREAYGQALVGAPAFPKRKLLFVLVDVGGGVNLTAEQAKARAFGMNPGDQSMKQVILEYSAGRQDLEGEVVGPFMHKMTGCDEDGMAAAVKPMLPTGYDNIVWYIGSRVSACGWAGVAPLGRVGKIGSQLWVNGTASCRVATHEFGHNLGLQHAARLRCMGASMLDDPSKCSSSEYGDSTDVMGDGCNHFNGYSKAYLTYFEKCNGVEVRGSGTFNLVPMEPACDGTQLLLVPMPKMRRVGGTDLKNYALELRAPIGLDAKLGPVVMVRLVAPLAAMRGSRMTWVLDTNPATTALDGLRQGETFTDPAGGVSFSVQSISPTGAVIKVDVAGGTGGGVCLDGSAFTGPGPDACGNAAVPTPAPAPPSDAGAPNPSPADAGSMGPGAGGRGGDSGSGGRGAGGRGGGSGGRAGGEPIGNGNPGSGGAGANMPSAGGQNEVVQGCGCRIGEGRAPGGGAAVFLAPGLVLLLIGLRRRRR